MGTLERQQFLSEIVLRRELVSDFTRYPFDIPAVARLETLALHPRATFFVGENGAGKSTLLEAIAVAFGLNPEGGSKHFTFSTRDSHADLHRYLLLRKGVRYPRDTYFLRAESFYNVATTVDALDVKEGYGFSSLHEKSHGEAFMTLFMTRFKGRGLYLLDEPEAALSPTRQLSLISRLHELVSQGSQFVVATHSPLLLAYPDAWIYLFDEKGIRRVAYEETEHFIATKYFLNNYARMLEELMRP